MFLVVVLFVSLREGFKGKRENYRTHCLESVWLQVHSYLISLELLVHRATYLIFLTCECQLMPTMKAYWKYFM